MAARLDKPSKETISHLHNGGVHLSNRRHHVIGLLVREFRVHEDTSETVQDIDCSRTGDGAISDRPSALGSKGRTRWMQSLLFLDMRLRRQ
jgi:hypothetical protein